LGEYYACITFAKTVEGVSSSSSVRTVLNKFVILYCLNVLDNDIVTLRHNDYIKSETVDLIRETILKLVGELSEYFIQIIDIIAPDDHVLTAPMGGKMDPESSMIYKKFTEKLFNNKY
jgi:hypothetical protein